MALLSNEENEGKKDLDNDFSKQIRITKEKWKKKNHTLRIGYETISNITRQRYSKN